MTDNQESGISEEARRMLEADVQLDPRLLSVSSLNPYKRNTTSPREQMFTNNLGQWQVIKGATERFHQTGAEREYGKYVFNITSPGNIVILKVIPYYPTYKIGSDSIGYNPRDLIIYEDVDTLEVGSITIERYISNHPYFGYQLKPTEATRRIRPDSTFRKGEVLMQTPIVRNDGGYMFGAETNVAPMSVNGVAEDGIIASDWYCENVIAYNTYEKRAIECGGDWFPINLYPRPDGSCGIFPEIGTVVREDGLLMALRRFNEDTTLYDMSRHGMLEFQERYDDPIYVPAGGKVIDIRVFRNTNASKIKRTPHGIDQQLEKYQKATLAYYQEIVNEYWRLFKLRKTSLKVSKEFGRLVRDALYRTGHGDGGKYEALHRNNKIKDWRIEFVIEYHNVPGVGFKVTDGQGGKGIIVKVMKREDMPIDDAGNRADLIIDPFAPVSRSIIGRVYEPKVNACFRDLANRLKARLNITSERISKEVLKAMDVNGVVQAAFQEVLGFYKIVSPKMYEWYVEASADDRIEELAMILSGSRVIYFPPDNPIDTEQMVIQLNQLYPNFISPVTFRGDSGLMRRTKDPVLISSMYFMALDKPGEDWAAVGSGKLQHYGVLAQLNPSNKYSSRIRLQPPNVYGETEFRNIVANTARYVAAEHIDRNNSRETMEYIVDQQLYAENPSKIEKIVDRQTIPYGNARPIQIVMHEAGCYGYQFKYKTSDGNPEGKG